METLRRAYLYLSASKNPVTAGAHRFLAILKDRALVASIPGRRGVSADLRRGALAWFDLGYFLAIDGNAGSGFDANGQLPSDRVLERAASGAPRDAGIQFGVALAPASGSREGPDMPEGEERAFWSTRSRQHLAAALELTPDTESLVARNLRRLVADQGYYGPPTTFEALRKRMAAEGRPR